MHIFSVATFGLLITASSFSVARADTIFSTQPALLCRSADALGKLSLPSGGDRAHSPQARPGDQQIFTAGGCVDISFGTPVNLVSQAIHTRVVEYDAKRGEGPQQYYSAKVDFFLPGDAPALDPHSSHGCAGDSSMVTINGQLAVSLRGKDHYFAIKLDKPVCVFSSVEHADSDMFPVIYLDDDWGSRLTVATKPHGRTAARPHGRTAASASPASSLCQCRKGRMVTSFQCFLRTLLPCTRPSDAQ